MEQGLSQLQQFTDHLVLNDEHVKNSEVVVQFTEVPKQHWQMMEAYYYSKIFKVCMLLNMDSWVVQIHLQDSNHKGTLDEKDAV